MHEFTPEIEKVAQEILEYSLTRLKENPPLDGPKSEEELFAIVGNTITEAGLGGSETLQLFKETLAICDRSAKNTFAEKFFGTTLISQIQTRSRTAVPGTEQPQTQQQVVKKPQQATINTYFVDKILVNAMDKSKKKNTSKKTSGNPTDV